MSLHEISPNKEYNRIEPPRLNIFKRLKNRLEIWWFWRKKSQKEVKEQKARPAKRPRPSDYFNEHMFPSSEWFEEVEKWIKETMRR